MAAITGMTGRYDAELAGYQPPAPYECWEALVHMQKVRLDRGTLEIF